LTGGASLENSHQATASPPLSLQSQIANLESKINKPG